MHRVVYRSAGLLFRRIDAPAARATQANRQGLHGDGTRSCRGAAPSRRD